MPEDVRPPLPDRQALIRFLSERRAVGVHEAAALLGWEARALVSWAADEEAFLPDGRIAFIDVALRLLQAWPRSALLEHLGERADLLPAGWRLVPVAWRLPLYIVRAMEQQARLDPAGDFLHGRSVDDYVANQLEMMLIDETVEALRDDPIFMEAYEYPADAGRAGGEPALR